MEQEQVVNEWIQPVLDQGLDIGTKILGAIVLWIIGRLVIKMAIRVTMGAMEKRKLDATVKNYASNALNILLNIVLAIAVLSVFGVETTTFAGLLAAGGVAIGMAWSGLLANFAAGVFMILLRPFKAGDMIQAAGVIGVVEEIGLFATTINTPDNIRTIVGNNKIFSDNISNFSANPYRRVDLKAQLAHGVDVQDAIARLSRRLPTLPHVLQDPSPNVELLEFNLAGPVLAVRPYCHNDNYWAVYFATNTAIKEEFGKAGYPVPEQHYKVDRAA